MSQTRRPAWSELADSVDDAGVARHVAVDEVRVEGWERSARGFSLMPARSALSSDAKVSIPPHIE